MDFPNFPLYIPGQTCFSFGSFHNRAIHNGKVMKFPFRTEGPCLIKRNRHFKQDLFYDTSLLVPSQLQYIREKQRNIPFIPTELLTSSLRESHPVFDIQGTTLCAFQDDSGDIIVASSSGPIMNHLVVRLFTAGKLKRMSQIVLDHPLRQIIFHHTMCALRCDYSVCLFRFHQHFSDSSHLVTFSFLKKVTHLSFTPDGLYLLILDFSGEFFRVCLADLSEDKPSSSIVPLYRVVLADQIGMGGCLDFDIGAHYQTVLCAAPKNVTLIDFRHPKETPLLDFSTEHISSILRHPTNLFTFSVATDSRYLLYDQRYTQQPVISWLRPGGLGSGRNRLLAFLSSPSHGEMILTRDIMMMNKEESPPKVDFLLFSYLPHNTTEFSSVTSLLMDRVNINHRSVLPGFFPHALPPLPFPKGFHRLLDNSSFPEVWEDGAFISFSSHKLFFQRSNKGNIFLTSLSDTRYWDKSSNRKLIDTNTNTEPETVSVPCYPPMAKNRYRDSFKAIKRALKRKTITEPKTISCKPLFHKTAKKNLGKQKQSLSRVDTSKPLLTSFKSECFEEVYPLLVTFISESPKTLRECFEFVHATLRTNVKYSNKRFSFLEKTLFLFLKQKNVSFFQNDSFSPHSIVFYINLNIHTKNVKVEDFLLPNWLEMRYRKISQDSIQLDERFKDWDIQQIRHPMPTIPSSPPTTEYLAP